MERDQICHDGKVIHFVKCGQDWRFYKREIQSVQRDGMQSTFYKREIHGVQRDEIQSTTKYKCTQILSTKERYTMCNEIRSNLLSTTCVSLATVMRGILGKSVAKTTDEHIFENIYWYFGKNIEPEYFMTTRQFLFCNPPTNHWFSPLNCRAVHLHVVFSQINTDLSVHTE